jgi:hypothetical protein
MVKPQNRIPRRWLKRETLTKGMPRTRTTVHVGWVV